MQFGGSKVLSGIKYVYLIIFFALLSGMFYPIINKGTSADNVIAGTMVLFLGLVGTILLYRAGTSERHQKAYIIAGFALVAVAVLLIYAALGKLG